MRPPPTGKQAPRRALHVSVQNFVDVLLLLPQLLQDIRQLLNLVLLLLPGFDLLARLLLGAGTLAVIVLQPLQRARAP